MIYRCSTLLLAFIVPLLFLNNVYRGGTNEIETYNDLLLKEVYKLFRIYYANLSLPEPEKDSTEINSCNFIAEHFQDLASEQQDAQEFFNRLIQYSPMEDLFTLKYTSRFYKKKIEEGYDGTTEQTTVIQIKPEIFEKSDVKDYNQAIKETLNFTDELEMLGKYITDENENYITEENNKYYINKKNYNKIEQFPKYLIIQISMFSYNPEIGYGAKQSHNLKLVEELNFTEKKYYLIGVVVHIGTTLSNGHYIAYVKRNKNWYEINDLNVNEITFQEMNETFNKKETTYLTFYSEDEEHKFRYGNKPVGLKNYDNKKCFANAIFQNLFNIPEIFKKLKEKMENKLYFYDEISLSLGDKKQKLNQKQLSSLYKMSKNSKQEYFIVGDDNYVYYRGSDDKKYDVLWYNFKKKAYAKFKRTLLQSFNTPQQKEKQKAKKKKH